MSAIAPPVVDRRWTCGRWTVDLSAPKLMGIVNVTPDSFSDGGQFFNHDTALAHARRLIDEGADLLDIGGESTRPGAPDVSLDEEMRRVVPLIEALNDCGVPLSVDTSKPEVMRAALAAGAAIVNDVRALRAPGALEVVAESDCGVVLMHMQGEPRSMQREPHYDDVVHDVAAFLRERQAACESAGISRGRVVLDPGFGFGKTATHNLRLLGGLAQLDVDAPLAVGWSRKSTLGHVTGRAVGDRVFASVAAAILAVERGASILRVHDVAATRDAIKVWLAMRVASTDSV